MAFPTLSRNPIQIDEQSEFATISTSFEAGYQQTRERHSRSRKTFTVRYKVDGADKDLIFDHFSSVRGSVAFDWTHPDTGAVHTVRYAESPKLPISGTWPDFYEITIKIVEI